MLFRTGVCFAEPPWICPWLRLWKEGCFNLESHRGWEQCAGDVTRSACMAVFSLPTLDHGNQGQEVMVQNWRYWAEVTWPSKRKPLSIIPTKVSLTPAGIRSDIYISFWKTGYRWVKMIPNLGNGATEHAKGVQKTINNGFRHLP